MGLNRYLMQCFKLPHALPFSKGPPSFSYAGLLRGYQICKHREVFSSADETAHAKAQRQECELRGRHK